MADSFKRIESNDVTECLLTAMENADKMEHVIVLSLNKGEGEAESSCFYTTKSTTAVIALWIIEWFKWWIMNHCSRNGDA